MESRRTTRANAVDACSCIILDDVDAQHSSDSTPLGLQVSQPGHRDASAADAVSRTGSHRRPAVRDDADRGPCDCGPLVASLARPNSWQCDRFDTFEHPECLAVALLASD